MGRAWLPPDCFVLVGYSVSKTMVSSLAYQDLKRVREGGYCLFTPRFYLANIEEIHCMHLSLKNLPFCQRAGNGEASARAKHVIKDFR